MIQKYKYGIPFETDAVPQSIPCAQGTPSCGTVTADESGFRFTCRMSDNEAVYGLGEALRGINKRGGRYVSFNTDQLFHMEDVLSLYASHNFLLLAGECPTGLFFDYPGGLEFDIGFTQQDMLTVSCKHADLYLYIITGSSLTDVVKQFRHAIGRSYIAPKWAMGYAQSRWGYAVPQDFREVVDHYRKHHIPLDAVYMDIDYMERFKDFTVNQETFPDFPAFVSEMQERGIHLVPIIDAAVKAEAGYPVCDEGLENDFFCTDEQGKPFEAAVWPGLTYLPDFLKPEVRQWFGEKYHILIDQGIEGFWNDMNEPAIFYTMQGMEEFRKEMQDFLSRPAEEADWFRVRSLSSGLCGNSNYQQFYHNLNGERICHEQLHNLYGYNMTRAAGEAFEQLCPDKRLLLFSRSSYIGSHRFGGIWTGDNASWWPHLLLNIQMMPSLNMCGYLFSGADIGGFGADVSRDLLLRWLAFGIFTPLMRNHSAKDTRRQECFRFEHPEDFAHVIGVRYRLLPYLYSEYIKAALNDEMYFRPLAFDYPEDAAAREVEDQLMLGDGLMIAPVYLQNASGRCVYLPEDMLFVKFLPDGTLHQEPLSKGLHRISAALNEVPLFIKKNHILPLAAFAETVAALDETHLELIGWITEPTSYTLYQDDGLTKDYSNPQHYLTLTKEPAKP